MTVVESASPKVQYYIRPHTKWNFTDARTLAPDDTQRRRQEATRLSDVLYMHLEAVNMQVINLRESPNHRRRLLLLR